jgi:hypothetical protein
LDVPRPSKFKNVNHKWQKTKEKRRNKHLEGGRFVRGGMARVPAPCHVISHYLERVTVKTPEFFEAAPHLPVNPHSNKYV